MSIERKTVRQLLKEMGCNETISWLEREEGDKAQQ
jgi:hypothetical protein